MMGFNFREEPPDVYIEPRCPVCGKRCDTVYRDRDYEIIGCDECLTPVSADDCEECYDTER